jgi:hypothetical protein
VKVNAWSGQRGKNRSELCLKSAVGGIFAEEVILSSIYHFAIKDTE